MTLQALSFADSMALENCRRQLLVLPRYERFGHAARHVIRAIHSVPQLEPGTDLAELEFYVGRTAATEQHLRNRYAHHSAGHTRGHEAGMPLFRASTEHVVAWEGTMNRALAVLARRRRLCVANLASDGRGAVPSSAESLVYLTWRPVPRRAVRVPERSDVDAIARSLSDAGLLSYERARAAFDPVRRPEHFVARVAWLPS